MSQKMRTFLGIGFLIGVLGGTNYFLLKNSVVIWYGILYSEWKSAFLNFHYQLGVLAFFFGLLLNIDSLRHKFWLVSTTLLLLFNILTLLSGLAFTNEVRTEEYILHFTQIQTSWILFLIYIGVFIRFILERHTLEYKDFVIVAVPVTALATYISLEFVSRLISDDITYFVTLTILLLGAILMISRTL